MNDTTQVQNPDPTPEERAVAESAIREFTQQQTAVPGSDKTVIDSSKFDGPIGTPDDSGQDGGVSASLSQDGEGRVVKLTFTNHAENTKYLAKPMIGLGSKLEGDFFIFNPAATYTGITVKRKPYSMDEMVPIEPSASISTDIDLEQYYDLPDSNEIKVRYIAEHPVIGDTGTYVLSVSSDWLTLNDGKLTVEDHIKPVDNLEDAKQAAYHLYLLDDENVRDLHNLLVKKEFPDGWVFGLEVKDPDQFTVPNSFLVLGKDGSVNWITPDDEPAITDVHSVKECLELLGKRLLDEATRKHGSKAQVQDIVSGYPNPVDNASVAVMGRTENNGVRIAVRRNDTDEQSVVVYVGDSLGSLTDWKVTKIYEQPPKSMPDLADREVTGRGSGQKVLEITKVKVAGEAVNPFVGAPDSTPQQSEVNTNSLKAVRIYDNSPEKHNDGPFIDIDHPKLDDDTKNKVLNYLKSGTIVFATRTILKDVFGPGKGFPLYVETDGTYWWQSEIEYYVRNYGLEPNKDFVEYVLAKNGKPADVVPYDKIQTVLHIFGLNS